MDKPLRISQNPEPGTHLLRYRGDTQTFVLSLSHSLKGNAWLRTNIGHAETARKEVIKEVQEHAPPLGQGWFDIPMVPVDERCFRAVLPLCEVGHFEAKCFFLRENDSKPVWPEGSNTTFNVEPANTCCANIIYNAFVRQFGPYRGNRHSGPNEAEWIQTLDNKGFTVIPPSGTFRDLIKELDFIVGELECRFLQLLPIHPTPTTFARMGRFGSPYAALSFTAVDPALAEFDPRATPLEQFIELVDAVHSRNARILIDIAINHTGWGARLHETHPEWLVRDQDGRIEVPGAWGVRWEDLTMLDHTKRDLWRYVADIFLTWCRRGVDGFRCDAGYMIPVPAWKYILAVVRAQYPDTVFLLEGLGGKISVTRDILNRANFNWAYSELFQNYDRGQIESYLPEAIEISNGDGITVHFAETHDNKRLASRSRVYAQMRTTLCALCSHQGGFGFANGVEWYATEKINVHDAPSLNWGAEINQVKHIHRLGLLLKNHPAFHDRTELNLVQTGTGNHVALLRHHIPSGKRLLIVANLDDETPTTGNWDTKRTGMKGTRFLDLLSEKEVTVTESDGSHHVFLEPGQVLCLTKDRKDVDPVFRIQYQACAIPERIRIQRLRAIVLDVFRFYNGTRDLGDFDPDQSASLLEADPISFCRSLNPSSLESRVILWKWPNDQKREVMIPPKHFLLIRAERPFRARIMDKGDRCLAQEDSLSCADGTQFALFTPLATPRLNRSYTLTLSVFNPEGCEHSQAPLLYLSRPKDATVKTFWHRSELMDEPLLFLGTNGRGGMLRALVDWGNLRSNYDALIAGNLNPRFPEDRCIMFSRCRAWIVFQGYSQEICFDCFDSFCFDYSSRGCWRFHVPSGQGEHVSLLISLKMISGENAVQMRFFRESGSTKAGMLSDTEPVQLILRTDIEDRNFHAITKAYPGPENIWPESVSINPTGFVFTPTQEHTLEIQISRGSFVHEPEWHYMVYRPTETERGLDPHSDLFSPGYFSVFLTGNDSVQLSAFIHGEKTRLLNVSNPSTQPDNIGFADPTTMCPDEALKRALDHYVVKRDNLQSVIAGYPWFLDWGRDSLIFTRGLIAAGRIQTAREIIKLFGQFEKAGTIPNMIRGSDAGNRDTTDAPLWFLVACDDLLKYEETEDFLDEHCNDRTIRHILISIANSLSAGTPNGIRMDPESCLLFSPAHFTWMDTNHPAGTPRQGYPIEIQALWFAGLTMLSRIDPNETAHQWKKLAVQVQKSILDYFILDEVGYLSDCLHAGFGEPPKQAVRDDALRPNQLFALTMDAVTDTGICRKIVSSCEELLVPGAIRSLADRPVRHPIQIIHHGTLMNDPYHPYQGRYQGDEDTKRKPAYHNGTAWTWLLPTFCEAWVKAYGDAGKDTAMAWLASMVPLMNSGCAGHLPEILDGDFPHTHRGCDAQAWAASELLRVWLQLDDNTKML